MDQDKEKLHSLRRAVAGRRTDGLLVQKVQMDPRRHQVCACIGIPIMHVILLHSVLLHGIYFIS